MNAFTDQLDQDMLDNHFNVEEFGEHSEGAGEVVGLMYRPASGAAERIIQGLFDESFSSQGTEATEDIVDHRPHLTCRQVDIETGKFQSTDRFIIRGLEYRPSDDMGNGQGIIRGFLLRVSP